MVYQSQGVGIHDKHIEIILRQMLRRVQVESTGDSEYIPGQMVDRFVFQEQNAKVLAEGGEPTTAKQVLLGITRASLLTDSFLSAASFQETTRVLTQAAVSGAQDFLTGLKENVIIGRLIPAMTKIPGMEELLKPQPVPEIAAVSPGGWLGAAKASDDSAEGSSNGAFNQASGGDDADLPNVFANVDESPPATKADVEDDEKVEVELDGNEGDSEDEAQEDVLEDAPEDELDVDEEEEPSDLDIAESGELSTNGLSPECENGASPSDGDEDAEGSDEPSAATDGEGDE